MDKLFEQFVTEKCYLLNVTQKTIEWYRNSYSSFRKYFKGEVVDLSKASLVQAVCNMREGGVSPATVNVYMRAVNSFLTWLYENEQTSEKFRVKPLKAERKIIQTFTDQ